MAPSYAFGTRGSPTFYLSGPISTVCSYESALISDESFVYYSIFVT